MWRRLAIFKESESQGAIVTVNNVTRLSMACLILWISECIYYDKSGGNVQQSKTQNYTKSVPHKSTML